MRLEILPKCLAGEPRKYQIRTGRYRLLSSEKMYFIFFIAGIFLLYFIVFLVFFYCILLYCLYFYPFCSGARREARLPEKNVFHFLFFKNKNFQAYV